MMGKIKVLYIDDERVNLLAFKSSFRRDFEIFTATSGQEGLDVLEQNSIEVVIADQRMPQQTGVEFFALLKEKYSNPMRILLTGYTDIQAVIDSINKGSVYRYITKPWDADELRLTIEDAFQIYELKEQNAKLNHKYQKVFTESTDPIILFDASGRIIECNRATWAFLKQGEDELHHKSFYSLIQNKEHARQILDKIESEGNLKDFECDIKLKGGELKRCLVSVNSINNAYDEASNFQAIVKDITGRSRLHKLLMQTVIDTQEKERERISRDLHDSLGQSLAAIKLHMEVLQINNLSNDETTSKEMDIIGELLQSSIRDLRRICFSTLPPVLYDYGLKEAVGELCMRTTTEQFKIDFNCDEIGEVTSKTLEIAIFRIIQEFINNSIKHAEANLVNIDVVKNEEQIDIELKDNGVGFDLKHVEKYSGHGLRNIKTRIESFDGDVMFDSTLGEGTKYKICIPINNN